MKLNYKKSGYGKPLFILHGLLGMLDNWQSIGKILSQFYEVFLIDARNHGHSPHSEYFNYDIMAEDLLEFYYDQNALSPNKNLGEVYIIGHSMGGKTAMKFAQRFPEKVEKLIVVDISPGEYPVQHDIIFDALQAVDLTIIKSRNEAEAVLAKYISEKQILQFLLKNLYWKEPGKLAWRFNLEVITKSAERMLEAITFGIFNKPALFIKGERSDYIKEEDMKLIRKFFPDSVIKTIPGSGHWIHADQPGLFVEEVVNFFGTK